MKNAFKRRDSRMTLPAGNRRRVRVLRRAGISLLEVLISIGILSVGLLSIASLIPAGQYALLETTKVDNAAMCGRAARGEIQTRDLLNPVDSSTGVGRVYWIDSSGTLQDATSTVDGQLVFKTSLVPYNSRPLVAEPFVIDPLPIMEALETGNFGTDNIVAHFPFSPKTADFDQPLARLAVDLPGMDLVNLTTSDEFARARQALEQIFVWSDDMMINIDRTNADKRPESVFTWVDSSGVEVASHATDTESVDLSNYRPIQRLTMGNYSWMMTVMPSMTELETPKQIYFAQNPGATDVQLYEEMAKYQKTFEVSVVVFYKRNIIPPESGETPSERMVNVLSPTGSDITLAIPNSESKEYLAIRPKQWLLLVGTSIDTTTSVPTGHRTAKWFRVINTDDEAQDDGSGNWIRNVTLDGADVNEALGNPDNISAVLVDGVVGVYTTTVRLN